MEHVINTTTRVELLKIKFARKSFDWNHVYFMLYYIS